MSWDECVTSIKNAYKPNPVQDITTVNWSTIPQADLDNDTFKNGDPMFLICPDRHCVDYVNSTPADHALCQCKDINGNPIPGCTPPSALYPEKASVCYNVATGAYNSNSSRACINQGNDWYQLTCYCCCSCFANGTLIAVPGPQGQVKIEDIQTGSKVRSAKLKMSGKNLKLTWGSSPVSFSQGTGPDAHQSNMISVIFENPETKGKDYKTIIVTPDHVFLVSTGKLRRADLLVPGVDFLVDKDGSPVAISEVSCGQYNGGVHHIATAAKFTGNMDDHLILAEGIVTGDFELQINSSQLKGLLSDDHYTAPKMGTDEYMAKNTNLKTVNYAKFRVPNFETKEVAELKANFYVHGEHTMFIPHSASRYLSMEQERDVDDKLDLIHFTELAPKSYIVSYLIKLFKGFFPDITIYFDAGRTEANAYSFVNQYGEKVVVVSGGLARISDLNLEGLAMIIAHMVSCVQKSAPVNQYGYTSVGMADYYSMMILQTVFYTEAYNNIVQKGMDQLEKSLFNNISDKDKIYESDPYKPSIDTRLDAMDAGNTANYPPPGIGGPEFRGLNLLEAYALAPKCDARSFITDDIDEVASAEVFELLINNSVLSADGSISVSFTIDTNLDYLFADKNDAERRLFTEEVRYILLHYSADVVLSFNMEMEDDRLTVVEDFEFEPSFAEAKHAMVSKEDPKKVILSVTGLLPNDDWKVTASNQVLSKNGSTMNPEKSSATFTTK